MTIGNNIATHIAQNPRLYEPQRGNNFRFVVTDLDGLTKSNAIVGGTDNTYNQAQEILSFSVESTNVPTFNQDTITITRGNAKVNFAGTATFSPLRLTATEFIGADTLGILLAWQALSYNAKTQTIGDVGDYKRTCYLMEYSQDYSKLIRTWKIEGGWISGIDDGDFSNSTSDTKTVSFTLTYDWAYLE